MLFVFVQGIILSTVFLSGEYGSNGRVVKPILTLFRAQFRIRFRRERWPLTLRGQCLENPEGGSVRTLFIWTNARVQKYTSRSDGLCRSRCKSYSVYGVVKQLYVSDLKNAFSKTPEG
ncbi:hypothetical protein L208DRAFT_125431 [Tricholoma matsutake]|nr:hypothetical protein L208DRAFT_125431 [Tricholoma matsutake 945]